MVKAFVIAVIAGMLSTLTGCSGVSRFGDHAEISGTPEGLRAMFDGLNGSMKTAKEAPDAQNQYLSFRSIYEQYKNQQSAPVK